MLALMAMLAVAGGLFYFERHVRGLRHARARAILAEEVEAHRTHEKDRGVVYLPPQRRIRIEHRVRARAGHDLPDDLFDGL